MTCELFYTIKYVFIYVSDLCFESVLYLKHMNPRISYCSRVDVPRTLLRLSLPNFNVTLFSLSDCICSCAIGRLVNRQYVEIDYSQCSVFMQCRWGKSIKFNINIMTENQIYKYSGQMKVDSSKRVCSEQLLKHHGNYKNNLRISKG